MKTNPMKTIFTILILISNLTLFSQVDKVIGNYERSVRTKKGDLIEWKLTLNENGTFFFQYYSNDKFQVPSEKNIYGKGTWTMENNVISFFSDKQKDIDEKNTLDFTNSKARFITKPTKNKTDQIIITRLQFLKSEIFWMAKTEILKI
jgi:hypothetical protein